MVHYHKMEEGDGGPPSSSAESEMCPVCHGTLDSADPSLTVFFSDQCKKHPLHQECILRWTHEQTQQGKIATCPVCRIENLEWTRMFSDSLATGRSVSPSAGIALSSSAPIVPYDTISSAVVQEESKDTQEFKADDDNLPSLAGQGSWRSHGNRPHHSSRWTLPPRHPRVHQRLRNGRGSPFQSRFEDAVAVWGGGKSRTPGFRREDVGTEGHDATGSERRREEHPHPHREWMEEELQSAQNLIQFSMSPVHEQDGSSEVEEEDTSLSSDTMYLLMEEGVHHGRSPVDLEISGSSVPSPLSPLSFTEHSSLSPLSTFSCTFESFSGREQKKEETEEKEEEREEKEDGKSNGDGPGPPVTAVLPPTETTGNGVASLWQNLPRMTLEGRTASTFGDARRYKYLGPKSGVLSRLVQSTSVQEDYAIGQDLTAFRFSSIAGCTSASVNPDARELLLDSMDGKFQDVLVTGNSMLVPRGCYIDGVWEEKDMEEVEAEAEDRHHRCPPPVHSAGVEIQSPPARWQPTRYPVPVFNQCLPVSESPFIVICCSDLLLVFMSLKTGRFVSVVPLPEALLSSQNSSFSSSSISSSSSSHSVRSVRVDPRDPSGRTWYVGFEDRVVKLFVSLGKAHRRRQDFHGSPLAACQVRRGLRAGEMIQVVHNFSFSSPRVPFPGRFGGSARDLLVLPLLRTPSSFAPTATGLSRRNLLLVSDYSSKKLFFLLDTGGPVPLHIACPQLEGFFHLESDEHRCSAVLGRGGGEDGRGEKNRSFERPQSLVLLSCTGSRYHFAVSTCRGKLFFWTLETEGLLDTLQVQCSPLVPPPVLPPNASPTESCFLATGGGRKVAYERVARFQNAIQLVQFSHPIPLEPSSSTTPWPDQFLAQPTWRETSSSSSVEVNRSVTVKTALNISCMALDATGEKLLVSDSGQGRFLALPYFRPLSGMRSVVLL